MASSGNTISIVDFPQSGISVFYLKGKYVIFWPRQDKSVSEDLKPAAAAASIRQQDAHPFAVTSNLAATSWIKGTDNSRVFLQGNDSALQEISLEQNGAGWTSTFYRVGGNLPPAPAIRVRKGTSIAVTSDQSDNSKLGGEHFGCTLFYQGTDNRIYFMQSSDPGFYTAPLPVASEPATEGTTIQAFQYGDRAEHLYVTFTVPNPDRFVRYKFEKPTQYNNLGTFRNVTPDFIYPAGITMTGLSFAAVRVALADGSPLEQYRFYAQLKKASGKPSLVEYIGAPDSSETTVTLVKGSLEIMDSDANPAKDNTKLFAVCDQTTSGDDLTTTIVVVYEGTNASGDLYFKSMQPTTSKISSRSNSYRTTEVWGSAQSLEGLKDSHIEDENSGLRN